MKATWILIANSTRARLFRMEKHNHDMELVEEFSHPQSREKIGDLITDSSGRYTKSLGHSPKSAFEEPNTIKQLEALRFAHILAQILDKGRTKNLYHNLIVIAPPHFQGVLNKCCNAQVKQKIYITVDKDYTKVRQHDLSKYLNGKLRYSNVA